MTRVAIPNYSTKPRGRLIWALPLLAVVMGLAIWAAPRFGHSAETEPALLPTYIVQPMNLDMRVVKDGELQAINNVDIICEVEGGSTIQELVKEGTSVKIGDMLAILDSSQIKQKIEDTSLDVQKATAALTTAKELRDIQQSQNAANLEGAAVALILAKLDLQQYDEGSYPQQLKNAKTDVEMATITLKNKLEDLDRAKGLFGKGFVPATDVKKAELEVTNATNALDKAETALTVLSKYTHEMDQAGKKNALAQAQQRHIRTQRENASNMAQKEADVVASDQALQLLKRRYDRLQKQFVSCTIKATTEGLVVYASSGDRNADRPIQEGATVRERQLLFRLPDTSSMKSVVRVQESQVGRLREGMRAMVKIPLAPEPVEATITKISVLADNTQRWWNPDLKEYPIELTLDKTPDGLKPGMASTVEIYVDRLHNVLAAPLTTVYAAGADTFVFQPAGDEITPIRVKLGQNNDTFVEVKEGVTANMSLLVLQSGQGRQLLERAGIKPTPVQSDGPGNEKRARHRKDAEGLKDPLK